MFWIDLRGSARNNRDLSVSVQKSALNFDDPLLQKLITIKDQQTVEHETIEKKVKTTVVQPKIKNKQIQKQDKIGLSLKKLKKRH